jgi:hypothetical protein
MTKRFNPNPRSRVRGIYIPPCGGDHGQETTYMNWCDQCRDIRKLELLQEQNVLLADRAENLGYQPRRTYTPPPPPPPWRQTPRVEPPKPQRGGLKIEPVTKRE